METQFKDTFFDSLKTMIRHHTWWYKTYEFFRYGLPRLFKNLWHFRKEMYEFEPWDYRFNLNLFARSLEPLSHYLEHRGHEVDESRMKKVEKIKRVIELLNTMKEDKYIQMAEERIGSPLIMHEWEFEETESGLYRMVDNDTEEEKKHNREIFSLSHKIEKDEWEEFCQIIKGPNYDKYSPESFDGSDMRCWWD